MHPNPLHARLLLAAFVAVGCGIVCNILYFQDRSVASAAERAKLEKAQRRAMADRNRRLSLDPVSEPRKKEQERAAADGPGGADQLTIARVGRFASPQAVPARPAAATTAEPERTIDVVHEVHRQLTAGGYEPGPVNGPPSLLLRGAIMAYEHDNGLPLTGEPSPLLLDHMNNVPGARDSAYRAARQARAPHAEQVMRSVQQSLAGLGYFQSKIDGYMGSETERAIREYEMDAGLVPTGRISSALLARLAKSAASNRGAGVAAR